MDNTWVIAATVLLGVVGVAVFFLSQPAQAKSRSTGGGMKPRGGMDAGLERVAPSQQYPTPFHGGTLLPLILVRRCRLADDWHKQ